jgi:hypothetical protein
VPAIDGVERIEPAVTGSEPDVLLSMVEYYRGTTLMKCQGLSDEVLARRAVPASTLSPLGILRHLTLVERYWFEQVFLGRDLEPLYLREDAEDADFNDLASSPVRDVVARYLQQCDTSRTVAREHGLDEVAARQRKGAEVNLRYIAVHMVDEYGRHCGHLDLLRESIDGATGE